MGLFDFFDDSTDDYYKKQKKEIKKAAKRNAEISLYDANVADLDAIAIEISAGVQLAQHMKMVDKVLGTATARLGKSGVAVSEGSALDIQVEIAREGAKDAEMIAYDGKTRAQRARSLAERYRMLAKAGLRDASAQASLLDYAAERESTVAAMQKIQFGIGALSQVGSWVGWW